MGQAARGIVGVGLEIGSTQGVVPLLANTALATTVVGYTQPGGGVAGQRIEIVVVGNTTTGAVTIAGTNPAGGSISEVTNTVPVPPSGQNPVLVAFRYVTQLVFASITSLTMPSGLANGGGLISLGGVQAEKYLLPATFKYTDKKNTYSPNEHTGLPARHTRIQQLLLDEGWEVDMACYPDSGMFVAYELFGPPTNIVPIAVSSTVLLKSGASASPITLTNPPGPGTQLQLVVTSSSTTGVFTLTGTNFIGTSITETITANAGGSNGNGTYTSTNSYWSITSITYTGLTGASTTVNGIGVPLLLTSTSVASSLTLTTGPSAPGMHLVFVVTGAGASGTITVTGTTRQSSGLQTVTEVLSPSGNGMFATQNAFKTVNTGGANQFTTTGLSSGSIAVYGLFAWQYFWNDITNADSFSTAMKAFYSGTDTKVAPGAYIEELDFELDTAKEMTFVTKGNAQDIVPVGDRTTTPMSGSRLSTLAQPPDLPIVGWQSLAWLDPQYTTPQTTAYGTLLTCKVACKVPKEPIYPANQTQRYGTVYYKKDGREFSFEATVDYKDIVQYELWRKNQKQTLSIGVLGPFVGMVSSIMWQKAWYWNLPFKFDQDGVTVVSDPTKANVTATYKGMCEYAAELGYSIQFVIVNDMPPVYNT